MTHEFRMPDIGEGLTEAEIVAWLVDVGDEVSVDQPVVEVETAKTTVEIPAPHAGVILSLVGDPGETVDVGDILFVIGDPGEVSPSVAAEQRAPSAGEPDVSVTDGPTIASRAANASPMNDEGSVRAMPIVRKLAKELGVDLRTISGSGAGGAITREDVEKGATWAVVVGGEARIEPLTSIRRTIADRMTESWTTIPHVTVQAEARAETLLGRRLNGPGSPHPIEALVALAVVPLLTAFPAFNAAYSAEGIVHRGRVDLGFAVDTPAGLKVVVLRDAEKLALADLTHEFHRLSAAAVDGSAKPEELIGQTFTISNIGALGGGHGTPIIPMGTSAILSIGRATEQAVVEDGKVAVGIVAPVDLSYDHRLIDGGLGQRFLGALVASIESG